jgi:hypothetical protein
MTRQSTPVDVDMAPPTANDAIQQVDERSTRCSASAGERETLEDLPRDSATALTSASSVPARSRVRGPTSNGGAPPFIPATRNSASRNERASTRPLFGSSSATSATDREKRAAAELTDVDVFRQFEYLEDFKLLVCKSHGYAVRNVKRHLEEQHPETKTVNKAAVVRLAGLEIQDPKSVHLPTSPVAPFASLTPPVSGFSCGGTDGECDFVSTSSCNMSRHWKAAHGQGVGRERLKHRKEVELQSFSPPKNQARWFVVDSGIVF